MNWNSTEFVWLDWTVLAIGVVGVIWAVWHAIVKDRKAQKGEDSSAYLFGKGEPWYVIGMAIFAANIGSEHLVGLAGTGAKSGVGMAHWEMQGWMILILGWLFVPFYQLLINKMGKIITMPDFLKFRYTQRTGSWLSIITLVAYILTKVSVTALTGGIFFEYLWGLNFWVGAIGLIILTTIFTVFGGMKGVMTLSTIQTPILVIGSFLVLFLGLSTLGGGSVSAGWADMMDYCGKLNNGYGTTHMFHWEAGDSMYQEYPGFVVFIGATIIGFWYWCTDQHIVQRVLGQVPGESNVEVMKRARRGTIAAGFFKVLPCFMFLIPGMIAAALAQYVLVGRIATVVVVVLGFAWLPIMMKMDTLYNYLQGIQSLLAPAMVAVFAMGIFFKKITPKAGEYTMITGFAIGMIRLVTNVITDTGKATMDGAFWDYTAWFWQTNWLVFECWLLVFLIIFMVVVSCFTPAPSKEQVEAITFTSDFKKSIRESWGAFDIIGTIIVIGLCAAFYAYFW